ncbi:putative lactoylglutathione lyase (Glo1) [Aspergillus candidus]|uniref:Glyoxalase/Bleomycin resistance protein/Dihydroxybiphenyl dioxygenase n=1 Tax=Aspergillus candidus TaxID=41067 RepID=A0A2I2FB29_ASPCN|nr:Glyoxalase/Bleomycin resistance protein/Dihydroxybiphenyl dioxygenase [Aspergillus candidus]PLB37831.1 Glyoxalase/Bleomycin resistance protein/Dihydroxybiphenyl dioxygenase [Aspergillus candidus]
MTPPNPSPYELGTFLPGGHNTDPPLPETSPTANYRLNHSMLRIRDPTRSLNFYINHMGMRTVWTMNTGPFTLYYLAYPSTATDRADLPAWAARLSNPQALTSTLGLLELYHVHGTERDVEDGGVEMSTGNTPPQIGFGHLGFTVPDVGEALERLRGRGVRVVKELGDSGRHTVPLRRVSC